MLAGRYVVDLSAPMQAVEEVASRLAALSATFNVIEKKEASAIGFEAAPQERASREVVAYARVLEAMLKATAKLNEAVAGTLGAAITLQHLKQVACERNWPAEATKSYHKETMALLDLASIILQDRFEPETSRQLFRERFRVGREGGARTIQVYFAYANADGKIFARLEGQLRVSVEIGHLNIWHRGLLAAGMTLAEAEAKLESSEVVTCLVSPDLFTEHSADVERAIAQAAGRPLLIVPIIVRPCLWDQGVLGPFKDNVLPKNFKPVTRWKDRDQALYEIAKDFYAAIRNLTAGGVVVGHATIDAMARSER